MSGDALLHFVDTLCRTRSYWHPPESGLHSPGEGAVAALVAERLRAAEWLTVVVDEVHPGRPNVLALDCDPEEVELLIVGHLDTVPPAMGWTVPEFTTRNGRYYALGAADTKAAIAAALEAMAQVGPTRGVGWLFYCDEEYHFDGMRHFLNQHPRVRPQRALSVCGAPARVMLGCRGLVEAELTLVGHPGHASRPFEGRSASLALHQVISDIQAWSYTHTQPHLTTLNIAALRAGSLAAGATIGAGPPALDATANRIPDAAWALVELRAGGPAVTSAALEAVIHRSLAKLNQGEKRAVRLAHFAVHLDVPGYASPDRDAAALVAPFAAVHQGATADPGRCGYLDLALLCGRDGSAGLCMSPRCGGAHGPDEWVDLASLQKYRDGVVQLLTAHGRSGGP